MAGGLRPTPMQVDHLLGDSRHRLPDLGSRAGPVGAAETGKAGNLAARVAADGGELVGGDVETVLAVVGEQQVVAFDPADLAMDQSLEASDAVMVVNDVVAGTQVAIPLADLAYAPGAVPAVGAPAPGDLLLPHHPDAEPVGDEATVDTDGEHRRLHLVERAQLGDGEPGLAEQPGHPVGGGVAIHGDDHVDPALLPAGDRRPDRARVACHGVEPSDRVRLVPGAGWGRRGLEVRVGGEGAIKG